MSIVNKLLDEKLKSLPRTPGVYFHKSKSGEVIYVGKAAVLRNRVKQYFQKTRDMDIKTQALVAEIVDTEWIEVESEIDALFLESEMIKRYKPRYNVLLRDDKSQLYVRISFNDKVPTVTTTRQPSDDKAEYYGPYYNGFAVKKALWLLRRVFPYYTHATLPKRADLNHHIGLTPGLESGGLLKEYKKDLRSLARYLSGERKALIKDIEKEMKQAAQLKQFELAAKYRNELRYLGELQRQIVFGREEFLDVSKDRALSDLKQFLTLKTIPRRIECYDISHMSGTNNVASMVVATNGVADKKEYRKFKMHTPGNNDFLHMKETLQRRFSLRNRKWSHPDLIVIDGGKGQLDAALKITEDLKLHIPMVGLAKREEEIIIHKTRSFVSPQKGLPVSQESDDYIALLLDKNSDIVKLLQRIRDEAHRFAVSYHTTLKRQGQTKSQLEDIPSIGPATRKKLIKHFGSLRSVTQASHQEIAQIVGDKKATLIKQTL